MFGFDAKYAMFDITPVENQFILDYLPAAKGDYIKVYLYGLMRCYHPEEDMNLDRMCHELNMSEDEITSAFRYWERRKLVRRVSDKPPRWQYINIKMIAFSGDNDSPDDPEYDEFCGAIYEAFDKVRRLHGSELNECFEWHESPMNLPTEVIIMLLNHMIQVKGRNFRFSEAGKMAARMAEENVRSVEAAEAYFLRNGQIYQGVREVLKNLGKNYSPSEAQVKLYQKWLLEWRFTHEAILKACELTAKGDPSMGYLDGILNSLKQEIGTTPVTPEMIRTSISRTEGLKAVLKELGRGEVNRQNLQLYDRMLCLYPQEVILIAAKECGHSGKDAPDILKLLYSWKEKGLENPEDVRAYVQSFHDQTTLIKELRAIWGTDETRSGKADRGYISKWENEFGFSRELILSAAVYAAEAKQPMAYLDKILEKYREKGIATPEEAKLEHDASKPAGVRKADRNLPAQNFTERDYRNVPNEMLETLAREMKAFKQENGGESDA